MVPPDRPRVGRWSRRVIAGRDGWPPTDRKVPNRIRRTGRLATTRGLTCGNSDRCRPADTPRTQQVQPSALAAPSVSGPRTRSTASRVRSSSLVGTPMGRSVSDSGDPSKQCCSARPRVARACAEREGVQFKPSSRFCQDGEFGEHRSTADSAEIVAGADYPASSQSSRHADARRLQ